MAKKTKRSLNNQSEVVEEIQEVVERDVEDSDGYDASTAERSHARARINQDESRHTRATRALEEMSQDDFLSSSEANELEIDGLNYHAKGYDLTDTELHTEVMNIYNGVKRARHNGTRLDDRLYENVPVEKLPNYVIDQPIVITEQGKTWKWNYKTTSEICGDSHRYRVFVVKGQKIDVDASIKATLPFLKYNRANDDALKIVISQLMEEMSEPDANIVDAISNLPEETLEQLITNASESDANVNKAVS